ncbi:MAG: rod shape-determining protein [Oscillospiraceae bacterium]|nr:rod shape-determining protein [Oscillospiraceae bacterium]
MKGIKIGVDFGSYSLRMCTENKPSAIDELSAVAFSNDNGAPIAYGKRADSLDGRTDTNISVTKMIKDGVISDFTYAEKILTAYISKVCGNRIYKPNVLVSLPFDVTSIEKKIFLDAVTRAGAGRACLVEGILASALGCGISQEKMGGRMVIDLGHETTEIGIISMGTIAAASTVRHGSFDIDNAIIKHFKKDRDIIIGPHTARFIKHNIASAMKRDCELSLMVSGKSGVDEMPISFEVTSSEIFPFVDEQISLLISEIHSNLQKISPELLSDAADHGITLCGGGVLLFDIAERFEKDLGMRCSVAENPEKARINGIHIIMRDDEIIENNGYQFIFKDDIRDRLKRFDKI